MKKKFLIVLASLLVLTLVGCSSTNGTNNSSTNESNSNASINSIDAKNSESTNQTKTEDTSKTDSIDISSDKLEIIKEYSVKTSEYSSYTYHLIVVKNNNDSSVAISSNSKAYDADGNILGIDKASVDVLAPGAITVLSEAFDDIDGVDSYETNLTASESKHYNEINSIIDIQLDSSTNKIFVTLENTGDYSAQFVQTYVIFLDENGECIDFDYKYMVDNDSEIKPGDSLSEEFKSNKSFASAEVYIHGRAKK